MHTLALFEGGICRRKLKKKIIEGNNNKKRNVDRSRGSGENQVQRH